MNARPLVLLGALAITAGIASAVPSVYPVGTTIYDPERTWNGYTVLTPLGPHGAVVIDMNGNVVKQWPEFVGSSGGPNRVLSGGIVVGAAQARPQHQETLELVQRDFDGNVTWSFSRAEEIEMQGDTRWSARQHHDWQRSDFPAGYYSPGVTPAAEGVRTLVLAHTSRMQPNVADGLLEDDRIYEISWDGEILWQWYASDHIDELGFAEDARAAIRGGGRRGGAGGPRAGGARAGGPQRGGGGPQRGAAGGPRGGGAGAGGPQRGGGRGSGGGGGAGFDWLHLNSATYLGPNRWYDAGDERFHPENVIVSSRSANIVAIISRADGSIVWRLGPDVRENEGGSQIRQIIGPHHPHMIPQGLPGAGNIMIFDNGGAAGYGFASPTSPNGTSSLARASSRVIEIDPVEMRLVWSYTDGADFFSTNISGAQRLPNGNTLITEGAPGRIFEVTSEGGNIVWEYISPFAGQGQNSAAAVYRAYRIPYDWIPQLERPQEKAVVPPPRTEFRMPATP